MQNVRSVAFVRLVDDLCADADVIAAALVDAAAQAVPTVYGDRVRAECRPLVEQLVPACLEHLRHGTRPTEGELQPVVEVSRLREREGRPLIVALAAVSGAIACFGGIVVRTAGIGRAGAIVPVLSAAAAITHDFTGALHAGRTPSRPSRPGWMEGVPPQRRVVLQLAAEGHSTARIAQLTGYSVQAIGAHLSHLMRAAGVRNRTALVAVAVAHGLVLLDDEGVDDGVGLAG